MIRWLTQAAWNLGFRRRYDNLERRVDRLEYWVRVHAPFVDPSPVSSPYDDPNYDPLSSRELKRAANRVAAERMRRAK